MVSAMLIDRPILPQPPNKLSGGTLSNFQHRLENRFGGDTDRIQQRDNRLIKEALVIVLQLID